jgi:hypothetical protein
MSVAHRDDEGVTEVIGDDRGPTGLRGPRWLRGLRRIPLDQGDLPFLPYCAAYAATDDEIGSHLLDRQAERP